MVRLVLTRALPPAAAVLAAPRLRRPDVALPLLGLAGWTLVEALAEHESANRAAGGGTQDRGTRRGLVGVHLLAWWAPIATTALRPTRRSRAALLLGTGLLAGGAVMRITAVRTLGEFFTGHVRVTDDQQVCDCGVYAVVRHPSYLGLFLLNVAPAVSVGAWWTATAVAAATTAAIGARVVVEERSLETVLGEPYRDYRARVPRWLPRTRAMNAPKAR
ncbi:Isoprenylcysteine carboxyl methyltransferase (ICMT) family protein [Actinosynnema pretiosum]|nr:Isoprenylcysteine carboxyl methyltransferase (ICMT) family protein [Actinosynnema pretiosum]